VISSLRRTVDALVDGVGGAYLVNAEGSGVRDPVAAPKLKESGDGMNRNVTSNILILGIGNILLGDEGAGIRVIERFSQRFSVPRGIELVDGGTAGMRLLDTLAGRDRVIVADAVKAPKPPGTLVRLVDAEVPALFENRLSPHQLGLADVLAALDLMDRVPAQLIVIGIVPARVDFAVGLSPEVNEAVDRAVEAVADQLCSWGCRIEPRVQGGRRGSPGLRSDAP
jgi:hydrogenase maturation protease